MRIQLYQKAYMIILAWFSNFLLSSLPILRTGFELVLRDSG